MNRRQLFLSTAKAALLTAFGGSWLSGRAKAQTPAAGFGKGGIGTLTVANPPPDSTLSATAVLE